MISKITKLLLHLNSLDFGGGGGRELWGCKITFFYSETVSKIISKCHISAALQLLGLTS